MGREEQEGGFSYLQWRGRAVVDRMERIVDGGRSGVLGVGGMV